MEKGKAAKKQQQEHKKKKNHENRSNAPDKHVNNFPTHSKKAKKNKNNEGEKTSKRSLSSVIMWIIFIQIKVILVVYGFLYLVDYEKFTKVKLAAYDSLNTTLSLLPPELVTKGKEAIEFLRPPAEVIFNQLCGVVSTVSTFLNTNPVISDHWVMAREIGSACGRLIIDYLRTLYLLICWCCNKLLP